MTWKIRAAESKASHELLENVISDKCAELAILEMDHKIKEEEVAELERIFVENENFGKCHIIMKLLFLKKRERLVQLNLVSYNIVKFIYFIDDLFLSRKASERKRKSYQRKGSQVGRNEETERKPTDSSSREECCKNGTRESCTQFEARRRKCDYRSSK
jgi:hypothetical protein